LDGAAYRNVDFMKKHDARGQALSVAKGANLRLDVNVIANETDR
jgi:hypothetical protein